MTTHDDRTDANGFVRFFRNYTKTWVHAVATAGLTAFGTLTIVHRWFAALALASYLVPPVVLYLRRGEARPRTDATTATDSSEPERAESRVRTGTSETPDASADATTTDTSDTESVATADAEPDATADAEPDATADQRPDEGTDSVKTSEEALERDESTDTGADTDESADIDVAREGVTDTDTDRDGSAHEAESADTRPEWRAVDAPTDATLRDATVSATGGGYAVGDGGTVLARDGDDEWTILLEDGPAAGSNDLYGVDATSDGSAVWIAGNSGSLGRVDPETGRHVDFTAPEGITDNWLGVAVGGSSGEETVLLITGSGAVVRGEYRDGEVAWSGPDKPGGGSSLSGVSLLADGVGYCCDTNDGVFETTDGGESFERVGLEGADGTLTDVATTGRETCLVSADDGVVHRYDGPTWTPERVTDGSLTGVSRHGERAAACADDAVHERVESAGDWERFDTDASGALLAVSIEAERGVAVGEDGTVLERR